MTAQPKATGRQALFRRIRTAIDILRLYSKNVRLRSRLRRARRDRDFAIKLASHQDQRRRQLEGMYNDTLYAIRALSTHEYGSLTPGITGWKERWDAAERRVLFFAPKDYGGSFMHWARAINATTDWAARMVTVTFHQFGYPNDLAFGAPDNVPPALHELIAQADVIHFKDEDGFLTGNNRLAPDLLSRHYQPKVYTAYGGMSRKRQDEPKFRSYVLGFDAVVSLTPDLCFPWLRRPTLIGHAVDTESIPVTWNDAWTVGHSPSTRAVKGTDAFLVAANRLSHRMGVGIDLITGVPHAEAVHRKESLGLFFDQAGRNMGSGQFVGWYGNSALEAASRGVPSIALLAETSFDRAAAAGFDLRSSCGILSTGPSPKEIFDTMRGYFSLSPEDRAQVSAATRRWVEDFHAYPVVGQRLAAVYDDLL